MKEHVIVRWKRNNKFFWKKEEKQVVIEAFEDLIEKHPKNNSNSKELKRIIRISDDIFIDFDVTSPSDDMKLYFWLPDGTNGKLEIGNEHKVVRALLNGYCFNGEEIPSTFEIKWRKDGKDFCTLKDRYSVLKEFQTILEGNPENNEMSKRIVHIMPLVKEIYINWDSTAENNQLYYKLVYKDSLEGFEIGCYHKKVWRKLQEICNY
mgnify:CR=1 FL=1